MGKCSYIGNDDMVTALNEMFREAVKSVDKNRNSLNDDALCGEQKEYFDFMRKLCLGNIDLERFGNTIMVDARFNDKLTLSPFELQRVFDILNSGVDSFCITNSGNEEKSFSITYSFTVPGGVEANE